MPLISRNTLAEFWATHPETEVSLRRWISIVRTANWSAMSEIQAAFPTASVLNAECVRFEIHGGNYRLIVGFHFRTSVAFVKFIGTHAEYDRVDAHTISLF
jgi:mRNA interferase HigB